MRIHLIDGTFELFRAHFSGRPDHQSPDGRQMKATVGLAQSLLYLLEDPSEAVTHVGIAFDNPIRSFRNDLFDGYKSDEGMLPELRDQFDDAEVAARAIGVTVWSMKEFEADDAIATAAARWRDRVEAVRILSPDKDFGQCLRGERVVIVDRIRKRVIDEASLRAKFGFGPESVPDFLALVGDDADGIPGLPKFGEKTASALLGQFAKLEAIPKDAARWPALRGREALATTLRERWEDALLYRRLATLRDDAPVGDSLEALEWKGVPREPFLAWCEGMGLRAMASVPKRWSAP